jgi:hypothetical protein
VLNNEEPFVLRERRVEAFDGVEHISHKDWRWLRLRLSGGLRYVTRIFITRAALSKLSTVTIGTAGEDNEYAYTAHTLASALSDDKYACSLPVHTSTETLLLSGLMGLVDEQDIDVFALLTPCSHLVNHSGEDLNRLADSYLAAFSRRPPPRITARPNGAPANLA